MTRWRIDDLEDGLLLRARNHQPVWDVAADHTLPGVFPRKALIRLAHQIRQDIWRACRTTRGFVPLVQVSTDGHRTVMRAGGTLKTRSGHGAYLADRIAHVLDSAENRARWVAHARRAGDGEGHVRQDPDRESG